ncbi:MAG: adenylyltransferase/cytidyltransferase family protein, partial [Anaerolineae bacterium]|nr:adenylyltransferase/cytidyltransferase family protein [Phycisphaerae bacterium]
MGPERKVCTLDQLLALRRAAQAEGKTIVHCHGCFDIVHPGHIHHLQFARSRGDLLIVSVSADSHVNKGVDRPLIPDDLRASTLAALECVDCVYLNTHSTATELLEALKPDVYVKGQEYAHNNDPRFLAERDTVTRHGGRVVFSSGDVVYSSTALIGSMRLADAMGGEKVARFCDRFDLAPLKLQSIVHQFRDQRVLVIGDYILDRYHFCDASGVAGEAPVMALRSLDQKDYDGGAGVIAAHLAELGAKPILVTSLADDEMSCQAEMRLRARAVDVRSLRLRRSAVTKHRYLVDETKMFKVDEGQVSPLDSRSEENLAEQILACTSEGNVSAVIFADFGYGTITAGLLDRIMPKLRAAVPIITADVSGRQSNLLRFRDVDLLCPTEREIRETLHDFSSGLGAVVSHLLQGTRAKQALITLGKQGLVTFDWPENSPEASQFRLRSEYLPALPARAVDPLGCGDALLA